ncbi:MAG: hypothetical protein ABIC96_01995 [Patescibacteria group bacterium]
MSTEELTDFPVDPDWTPTTNIRPHHIVNWMSRVFVDKLKRCLTFPRDLYFGVKYSRYVASYEKDIYGSSEIPQDTQRQELKEPFMQRLRNLPGDCIVQLDLAPDGICNNCVTGKHCRATNFRVLGRRRDIVAMEESKLGQIRRRLLKKGFQQNTDFKMIQVNTELFDYQGEDLWINLHQPQPIIAQYNAILVRMDALRKIVDNKF